MSVSEMINPWLIVLVSLSGVSSECQLYRTTLNDPLDLGCLQGPVPFHGPWDPFRVSASFLVFDQNSRDAPSRVLAWNDSLRRSDEHFDQSDRIVFIVHGYIENGSESWMHALKDAYFKHFSELPVKIISVDWTRAARGAGWIQDRNYVQAAANTKTVGRILAALIKRMISEYHIPEESFHLMGHSLGAHVIGVATEWLNERHQIKVGRTTAFDAASPVLEWFDGVPNRKHSHFLEACHSSARTSLTQYLNGAVGIPRPYGHVDFYPNGGTIIQPACRANNSFFCSHRRCYIFYTAMLNKLSDFCDVDATRCKTVEEATSGKCNGSSVRLWNFSNHIAEASASAREDTVPADTYNIFYFETDLDKLRIRCDVDARNRSSSSN